MTIENSDEGLLYDLFMAKSQLFGELVAAKTELGNNHNADVLFGKTRVALDKNYQTAFNSNGFLNKMERIMKEIDENSGLLQKKPKIQKFLDVGAAPGGFSKYWLKSRVDCQGIGINLPRNRGGHIFSEHVDNRARYLLHENDLTDEDFFYNHPLMTLESHFDLVILDCLYLDDKAWTLPQEQDSEKVKMIKGKFHENHQLGQDVLLATQLYLAVNNLGLNASLIARITAYSQLNSNLILLGMKKFFKSVIIVKPTICHALRSSCYVVFDGFLIDQTNDPGTLKLGQEFLGLKERLRVWLKKAHDFSIDGIDFSEILLNGSSLESILNNETVDCLITLFESSWKIQKDAINFSLKRFRTRT